MDSDSPIFWFLPPELLFQTGNFHQIIFLFLVSIPPVGCQEHSLPNIVHTNIVQILRSTSYRVTAPHMSLPLFPIFTHNFLFSPSLFIFHATLRGPIPSLTHDTKEVAYGGKKVQSASIMYNVWPRVQPHEARTQPSRWLHTRAISQELKIHVWPETKKLKDVELCFLYLILCIWVKPRALNSSLVQMLRTLMRALM